MLLSIKFVIGQSFWALKYGPIMSRVRPNNKYGPITNRGRRGGGLVIEIANKTYEQGLLKVLSYIAFHGFGQAKFAYGGSILGSSQFSMLLQLPLKSMLNLKVVKIEPTETNLVLSHSGCFSFISFFSLH